MVTVSQLNPREIEADFRRLEDAARGDLSIEGFKGKRVSLVRSAAIRYIGQSFEIDVPWTRDFESHFHRSHEQRYGYADLSRPTEIVSIRVRATGITDKPSLRRFRAGSTRPTATPAHYTAAVMPPPVGSAGPVRAARASRTPIYNRTELAPGTRVRGPAIIAEYSATTLVPDGWVARLDPWRNIVLNSPPGH
jgi:N-methylhydantoinase A